MFAKEGKIQRVTQFKKYYLTPRFFEMLAWKEN